MKTMHRHIHIDTRSCEWQQANYYYQCNPDAFKIYGILFVVCSFIHFKKKKISFSQPVCVVVVDFFLNTLILLTAAFH